MTNLVRSIRNWRNGYAWHPCLRRRCCGHVPPFHYEPCANACWGNLSRDHVWLAGPDHWAMCENCSRFTRRFAKAAR